MQSCSPSSWGHTVMQPFKLGTYSHAALQAGDMQSCSPSSWGHTVMQPLKLGTCSHAALQAGDMHLCCSRVDVRSRGPEGCWLEPGVPRAWVTSCASRVGPCRHPQAPSCTSDVRRGRASLPRCMLACTEPRPGSTPHVVCTSVQRPCTEASQLQARCPG